MQQGPAGHHANTPHLQHRGSAEGRPRSTYAANGNGAMPIPQGQPSQLYSGASRNGNGMQSAQPFDVARSPPNPAAKNTKHVPCKFFRQGTCQAGAACPFLHSTDTAIETAPCKYFTKGNCKFGAKCALAHILPDGRRVNRPNPGMGMGMNMNGGHLNLGGRVEPPAYFNQDSALANSIHTQQQYSTDPYAGQYLFTGQDDPNYVQDRYSQYPNIQLIETGLSSNPGSKYGSPVDDSRLPLSPVGRHLTALDAPLPASFDSNGISHIARYGAVAASVPSKFGMESPPASLPARTGYISDAFRVPRSNGLNSNMRNTSQLGSSPPAIQDESIGQRLMHSQNVTRPRMLSSSVPRVSAADDWDDHFTFEETLLPTTLHEDVLTPDEKRRRLSRPEQDFSATKDTANALRIPSGSSSKVGSPLGSSPSRFSALFAKQREKKEQENGAVAPSTSGQVGSPLRESLLHENLSPSAKWTSDDQFSAFSSPPRNSSMSVIAQQMHRMQLQRTDSAESNGGRLQPGSMRHASTPIGRFDRTISSPRLASTRIDEEQGDLVFSMDDEGSKRSSMIWGGRSPNLRPQGEVSNGILE